MTARPSYLRLIEQPGGSPPSAPHVPSSCEQPALPFGAMKRTGIAVLSTCRLTGEGFRQVLDDVGPTVVLDMRPLPRLDFIGYSRHAAFEDFDAMQARYARASLAEVGESDLALVAALERAGATKLGLFESSMILLVDEDVDANLIAGRLAAVLATMKWPCSVALADASDCPR